MLPGSVTAVNAMPASGSFQPYAPTEVTAPSSMGGVNVTYIGLNPNVSIVNQTPVVIATVTFTV